MNSTARDTMIIGNAEVPVVIIDSRFTSGLGITRSLGRLGINIHCIDSNFLAPAFFSKYCKSRYMYDDKFVSIEIKCLLNYASKIGTKSVLFATTDELACLLLNHREILKQHYILPSISPEIVESLISKKEMFYLAKKNEICTPNALFPISTDDLEENLEKIRFPVMLKGIYGNRLAQKIGKKMFIVKTKKQLSNIFKRFSDFSNPTFMIQEYIPGRDDTIWMFNGYFDDKSACLFGITGRKLRQAPVHTGATSLGICERNDRLYELVLKFMKRIEYKGILDIGFKYDQRDDEYKVLDINPRIGSTFRLFVGKNGLDVARAAYLDLTGQNVPSTQMVEGRKWVVENSDLISSVHYILDKNLTVSDWLKSYHGVQEAGWGSLHDPLPFFAMLTISVGDAITYLTRLRG